MGNSKLVDCVIMSPNKTVMTNKKIDTITIHCMAGQCSANTCGEIFANPKRQASSNYGIGPDGKVGLYVDEKDRSWCTSSRANDSRAITIEVASDRSAPFAVTQKAYDKLILLLVDICKRNGIKKLLWKNDKSLIGQVDKQNMTVHCWFANKDCPGKYLLDRHAQIAKEVNTKLGVKTDEQPANNTPKEPTGTKVNYSVKITVDSLNIRTGPGTNYAQVGVVHKNEVYAIVESSNNWGKLKNGKGWISLNSKYSKKVTESSNTSGGVSSGGFTYAVGKTYTLQAEMKVRKGPGTDYAAKKYSELSSDGKKHDKDGDGALDKGTKITCKDAKVVGRDVWIKCASGWIAAYYNGKVYVK